MELHGQFDPKIIENEIRGYKKLIRYDEFFKNEIDIRQNKEIIGYVDGPPTMNGEPHVGHLRGRIIKDLWFRFQTLKHNKIIFRPGWDTQGLPVELQAEKELGLTGNKTENINKVGIEKIVETCKSIVKKRMDIGLFTMTILKENGRISKLLGIMGFYRKDLGLLHFVHHVKRLLVILK